MNDCFFFAVCRNYEPTCMITMELLLRRIRVRSYLLSSPGTSLEKRSIALLFWLGEAISFYENLS
jgi:hypothetical protein